MVASLYSSKLLNSPSRSRDNLHTSTSHALSPLLPSQALARWLLFPVGPNIDLVTSAPALGALTKRVLKQLTNIQHSLSGGLDKRWSGYVSVCDPTNNNQSQQDHHHTYRRCVITLFPNHSRALQSEEHPTIRRSAARAHVAILGQEWNDLLD